MSNKFPEQEPERHEMNHIGDGEFFCPICYRQVRMNEKGHMEVMTDSKGRPLEGDVLAIHYGTTVLGFEMNMSVSEDVDSNLWDIWKEN